MEDPTKLIEAGWQARREGRPSDAEKNLLQAIAASRQSGARLELILGLKALAHVVRDAGQIDRALPLYEEAVSLSREEGDIPLLAHTMRHLADLHREAGRLNEADACYGESLDLYRSVPNPPALDVANALRPAALLREEIDDLAAARHLWSQARRYYEAADVQAGVEECDRRLAKLS